MTDPELLERTVDCIQRIHIITGWNLPDDKNYMKILSQEFMKKLREGFENISFEEIHFAFRKNGIGVKDWGKNMNLDLICNLLSEYCMDRERLSYDEERMIESPAMKSYTDEELDNLHRAWTEEFYQQIRNGKLKPVPDYTRAILVKDKIIDNGGQADEFFVRKLNEGAKAIYEKS